MATDLLMHDPDSTAEFIRSGVERYGAGTAPR
jgi:hypothetical protein